MTRPAPGEDRKVLRHPARKRGPLLAAFVAAIWILLVCFFVWAMWQIAQLIGYIG